MSLALSRAGRDSAFRGRPAGLARAGTAHTAAPAAEAVLWSSRKSKRPGAARLLAGARARARLAGRRALPAAGAPGERPGSGPYSEQCALQLGVQRWGHAPCMCWRSSRAASGHSQGRVPRERLGACEMHRGPLKAWQGMAERQPSLPGHPRRRRPAQQAALWSAGVEEVGSVHLGKGGLDTKRPGGRHPTGTSGEASVGQREGAGGARPPATKSRNRGQSRGGGTGLPRQGEPPPCRTPTGRPGPSNVTGWARRDAGRARAAPMGTRPPPGGGGRAAGAAAIVPRWRTPSRE